MQRNELIDKELTALREELNLLKITHEQLKDRHKLQAKELLRREKAQGIREQFQALQSEHHHLIGVYNHLAHHNVELQTENIALNNHAASWQDINNNLVQVKEEIQTRLDAQIEINAKQASALTQQAEEIIYLRDTLEKQVTAKQQTLNSQQQPRISTTRAPELVTEKTTASSKVIANKTRKSNSVTTAKNNDFLESEYKKAIKNQTEQQEKEQQQLQQKIIAYLKTMIEKDKELLQSYAALLPDLKNLDEYIKWHKKSHDLINTTLEENAEKWEKNFCYITVTNVNNKQLFDTRRPNGDVVVVRYNLPLKFTGSYNDSYLAVLALNEQSFETAILNDKVLATARALSVKFCSQKFQADLYSPVGLASTMCGDSMLSIMREIFSIPIDSNLRNFDERNELFEEKFKKISTVVPQYELINNPLLQAAHHHQFIPLLAAHRRIIFLKRHNQFNLDFINLIEAFESGISELIKKFPAHGELFFMLSFAIEQRIKLYQQFKTDIFMEMPETEQQQFIKSLTAFSKACQRAADAYKNNTNPYFEFTHANKKNTLQYQLKSFQPLQDPVVFTNELRIYEDVKTSLKSQPISLDFSSMSRGGSATMFGAKKQKSPKPEQEEIKKRNTSP